MEIHLFMVTIMVAMVLAILINSLNTIQKKQNQL